MDWDTEEEWQSLLGSSLPQNAILVSNDRDEITPLWYLQIVEGERRDVLGLFPLVSPAPGYSNIVRLLDSVHDSGRPIFAIKQMPGLSVRYELEPAGAHLYHVVEPLPASPAVPSSAVVGGKLSVIGYSVVRGEARPGGSVGIVVYWQPQSALGRNFKTSLQLIDDAGNKVAQGNDHQPGGDIYPSSLWLPGEILHDEFMMDLGPGLARGGYHLAVKVYDPESEQDLGDLTEIGTLTVQ